MTDKPPMPYWTTDKISTHGGTGQEVIEREYHNWPTGEPTPPLLGIGSITVGIQTPQGPIQHNHVFVFPIKAEDVKEAFMRYDAHLRPAAEAEVKMLEQQQRDAQNAAASKIVVAQPGAFVDGGKMKA